MFSRLFIQFQNHFNKLDSEFNYNVNPGNTPVPLINIEPKDWRINEIELLIQFQGNELKFYTHKPKNMPFPEYKERLRPIVQAFKGYLTTNNRNRKGQLKKLPRGTYNSCFVFKENLKHTLLKEEVTIEDIYKHVLEFYKELNGFILSQQAVQTPD